MRSITDGLTPREAAALVGPALVYASAAEVAAALQRAAEGGYWDAAVAGIHAAIEAAAGGGDAVAVLRGERSEDPLAALEAALSVSGGSPR